MQKKPKPPKAKGGRKGRKDPITGSWGTEDGLELTFTVASNNTPSKKYFAVADSFDGYAPKTYKGYADTNANGVFDSGIDKYTGTASVASWDGVPRYSGTFRADSGKLLNLDGPANSFSITQDFFG